jgi:signal transduction histidine kinase
VAGGLECNPVPPLVNPFKLEAAFDSTIRSYREHADKIMLGMCGFLLLICTLIAALTSSWPSLFAIGIPTIALAAYFTYALPGHPLTRLFMGCAFMAFTGLIIHMFRGDIEAHFAAFGLIGILLYYRDWRVVGAATIFIYLHHLCLGLAQTYGAAIYVFDTPAFWSTFGLHVAYFLPFVAMMGYLAVALRKEAYENRLVIEMAQKIADGDFTHSVEVPNALETDGGLLSSVTLMHSRIREILWMIPAPTLVLRADDMMIVSVNIAWMKTFDPSKDRIEDLVGTRIDQLGCWVHNGDWSKIREFDPDKALSLALRVECLPKDEQIREVEFRKIVYQSYRSKLLIVVADDVTARNRAKRHLLMTQEKLEAIVADRTQELEEQKARLQIALDKEKELSGLQRQFVSMVSHEFRTPLAIIDGSAQRMIRRHDKIGADKMLDGLGKVRTSVSRLTDLIESVLSAARLEDGSIAVELMPFDIRAMIDEVFRNLQEISPDHQLFCDLQDMPDMIDGDEKLLRQVVSNLITNATKYCPAGTRVWIEGGTCDDDRIWLAVRDEGPGIPKDEVDKLFDRYYRGSTSTGIIGTGIGLHIVQVLVNLHRGDVDISSVEGEGSTFWIFLPKKATVAQAA